MINLIGLKVEPPLAELVIDRPEKRNAISINMWASIPNLVDKAESDDEVKVLIIHGGDAGAFAAGADIAEFEHTYATSDAALNAGKTIAEALAAIEDCTKPTIAAIEGACVGGGVSLAMACDLRIAGTSARFGITPGKLGLVYPAGDTRRLLAAIGPGAAKDVLFTGRIFSAREAADMRLIERLSEDSRALQTARDWALEIAATSQWSTRAIKQMIKGVQSGWADDDPAAVALFIQGFSNSDFKDGYRAFLEKRPPRFVFK